MIKATIWTAYNVITGHRAETEQMRQVLNELLRILQGDEIDAG